MNDDSIIKVSGLVLSFLVLDMRMRSLSNVIVFLFHDIWKSRQLDVKILGKNLGNN